jgi:hypothetical protein
METEAIALTENIISLSTPWFIIIGAGIIGLWLKELMTDIVASIRWKLKSGFEPGDVVFINQEKATIVSIGITETIFEIHDTGRGKLWRFIDNTRMPYVTIEKIIEPAKCDDRQ